MKNTERSSEEHLLSKRDWESIFNTIPDMITIHDKDFNIIKANKAAKKILGLPILEVTETKCFKYYHGADGPVKRCPSCQCLKTGKPATFEVFEPYLKIFLEIRAIPRFNINNEMVGLIHIIRDITKRKKIEKKLETISNSDELTGLFNRRGFFMLSEQHRRLADRNKRGMSLLYLDLDGMKAINDKFGHKAGDQALIDTANILKKTFRQSDIIARIGGDEFSVLITDHSEPDIENIIIKHVQDKLRIYNEQGIRNYKLSLSIGIAHYHSENPCSIDEFLTKADESMYEDKKNHLIEEQAIQLLKKEELERRTFKRFKPDNNRWAELDRSGRVRIKDISLSGICLKTSQYLTADSTYTIKIFPTNNKEITSTCVVVWSYLMRTTTEKDYGIPNYETGLKFVEMNDHLKSSLEKFITNLAN
jgi:diguanylate cyclase (GGDEF)-like protein/PAS domain S-box-containing protein